MFRQSREQKRYQSPEIEDSEEDEEQRGQAPAAAAEPTEEEFQAELARQQSEAHRRMLLDDVPAPLKRRLHQEDQEPAAPPGKRARVTESLVVQVMLGTLHTEDGRANEWVTQYELGLLRELTGLPPDFCATASTAEKEAGTATKVGKQGKAEHSHRSGPTRCLCGGREHQGGGTESTPQGEFSMAWHLHVLQGKACESR